MDFNSKVRIAELSDIDEINDSNIIIIEDEEDTKKTRILDIKRMLSGDYSNPNRNKFYSSYKVDELLEALNILIRTKASKTLVNQLSDRINQIVSSDPDGTKDKEIIDARGGLDSLSDRFDHERDISNTSYMKKVTRRYNGDIFDIHNQGNVIITLLPKEESEPKSNTDNVIIASRNNYNYSTTHLMKNGPITFEIENNGFTVITHGADGDNEYGGWVDDPYITVEFGDDNISTGAVGFEQGHYFLYTNIEFGPNFHADKNAKINIIYYGSGIDTYEYNHEEVFEFDARKRFYAISIHYDNATIYEDMSYVKYTNIMITKEPVNEYIEFEKYKYTLEANDSIELYNNDYIITHNSDDYIINVEYIDQDFNIESFIQEIESLKYEITKTEDRCGLMTDYGKYQFFENYDISSYPVDFDIEDDKEFSRNGVPSKKIFIRNDCISNPTIKQIINCDDIIESVSLYFYIDKTTFSNFTDKNGIKIYLCSDSPDISSTNYLYYTISKYEMVQGWNCIKRSISEFSIKGSPDIYNFKTISIEIERNDNLNGYSLYINSVAFNQKMKPTVLLAFDGVYDTSCDYLYPYMEAREIPATLFINNSRTLDSKTFDSLIKLRVKNKWDIGVYGCNPNKEILTKDDNYLNQYLALRTSKQWVQDNIINSPIAYCAPYNDLRPITVPILKDLGYKIARVESDSYISNFTKYDFVVPCHLIGNTNTFDEIKAKINYAIKNNVSLCLYTNDVTEYGSDISATKATFESIIDYIIEMMDNDKLQCMSFSEFYNKCINF